MNNRSLKRPVLIIAALSSFMAPFMGSAVNLALPEIGEEFGADAIGLNWIVSSYILASAILLLPAGRMADRVGRKAVFTAGILIFTLSTVAILFSNSLSYLLFMRVVQGAGSALLFSTSLAIVTAVFPPGERGAAMGINVTAVYAGLSAGPFIGGYLTAAFGWRSLFLFLIPFGVLCMLLIAGYLKREEWSGGEKGRFDWPGSMLYGVSLFLLMYGFSRLQETTGLIMTGSGVVIFLLFLLYEKGISNPVLNISVITGNRVFAYSCLAAFIHYSATSATGFFISLYLRYIKETGPEKAGLILMAMPVAMMILSPFSGRLSDRHDPGIIASWGMAITAAGIIAMLFLTEDTTVSVVTAILLVMGTGFAFFSSPNTNAIMSSAESRHLGLASAVTGTARMTGQMVSMGISMLLFALIIGREAITPDNHADLMGAMRVGFSIFALLCIGGLFASRARNRGHRHRKAR